jgi:hypothetical protein
MDRVVMAALIITIKLWLIFNELVLIWFMRRAQI